MNHTTIALILGFVAGIVGGYFGQSLAGARASSDADVAGEDVAALQREVADLKASLARSRDRGATLEGSAPAPESLRADAAPGVLTPAQEEALLARMDARVEKAVEARLEELQSGSAPMERARPSKKRVDLATAAAELELTAQQEDELRRLYAENERKILQMLAEPDGDPAEVKREIQEAVKTPGGPQKLMGKYMPKVFKNIGTFMTMQAEREAAVVKTLGPEKAKKLNDGYTIEEDDFLGLGGSGGGMRFETSVEAGGR